MCTLSLTGSQDRETRLLAAHQKSMLSALQLLVHASLDCIWVQGKKDHVFIMFFSSVTPIARHECLGPSEQSKRGDESVE